jgi:hypothetical protein
MQHGYKHSDTDPKEDDDTGPYFVIQAEVQD